LIPIGRLAIPWREGFSGSECIPLDLKEIHTFLKPDDLEAALDKFLVLVVSLNPFWREQPDFIIGGKNPILISS